LSISICDTAVAYNNTYSQGFSHVHPCVNTKPSVAVTALYSLLSADSNPPTMAGSYQILNFSEEQIQQSALDLCEVFQFEFIFTQPCRQLEAVIEDVLTQLKYKEILLCNEVCCIRICNMSPQ
jgi:hypothetical protein